MNRPDELIKELENFSNYDYGDELSIEECHIIADYIKSLEKSLDKACELLEEQTEEGDLLCPCEYLGICRCMSTENGYECDGDNDYKWKEALMKDVE